MPAAQEKPSPIAEAAPATQLLAAQEQLRLWAAVLAQSSEGIMVCDVQERIVAVNPAFERLTGFSAAEAIGKTPRMLHSGSHNPGFYAGMWRAILNKGQWSGEIWNRRKNGELYVEWLTVSAVRDEQGRIAHYLGIFSDLTDNKAVEERVRYLAHYDALTDLPNRGYLVNRLEQLIETARRGERIAVLFLDLDRFKNINNSMGPEAGDTLLQTVAQRLLASVRHSDTVARMGGDEFVILLSTWRTRV
jgi:PAS domain S-box-containing protein